MIEERIRGGTHIPGLGIEPFRYFEYECVAHNICDFEEDIPNIYVLWKRICISAFCFGVLNVFSCCRYYTTILPQWRNLLWLLLDAHSWFSARTSGLCISLFPEKETAMIFITLCCNCQNKVLFLGTKACVAQFAMDFPRYFKVSLLFYSYFGSQFLVTFTRSPKWLRNNKKLLIWIVKSGVQRKGNSKEIIVKPLDLF